MYKKITLFVCIAFTAIVNAQSIEFTSATSTKGLIANTIQVDYQYAIGADSFIYCAIENQPQTGTWSGLSTVATAKLDPAISGNDVTGSFFFNIPTTTKPFYDLPNGADGLQTVYRIKILSQDIAFNDIAGAYSGDWIQLTNYTSFTGDTDSDWSNKNNWDTDVPNATTNVTIPASKNAEIYGSTGASENTSSDGTSTLPIFGGGSLLAADPGTGF